MCERNSHARWRTRSTSPLSGPMPKSQKARKQARFNPLAAARRAAEGQEEPGTSAAAAEEAPKLSAHQLRHIERKRLQVCRPRRDPARHHERSTRARPAHRPRRRRCAAPSSR